MQSPFPGMNPYLEDSTLWHEAHTRLIVTLADYLNPLVSPRYYVVVEQRNYVALTITDELTGLPDLAIVEDVPYLTTTGFPAAMVSATPMVVEVPVQLEEIVRYLEVREADNNRVVTAIELLSHANKSAGKGREQYEKKRADVLGSRTHLDRFPF